MSADGKFESVAHHLQRTELEALRAENVRLREDLRVTTENNHRLGMFLSGEVHDQHAALRAERDALQKERDEALEYAGKGACCVDVEWERDQLRARVQRLECVLRFAIEEIEGFCEPGNFEFPEMAEELLARAALESGTGPNKTYGGVAQKPTDTDPASGETSEARERLLSKQEDAGSPSSRPLLSPAPKTFTETQIAIAVTGADQYAASTTDTWRKEFFRALGLGEP